MMTVQAFVPYEVVVTGNQRQATLNIGTEVVQFNDCESAISDRL